VSLDGDWARAGKPRPAQRKKSQASGNSVVAHKLSETMAKSGVGAAQGDPTTLDTTWLWTAIAFLPLALLCFYLAWRERPRRHGKGSLDLNTRTRQGLVASALALQGVALALRGAWCLTKFSPHVHSAFAMRPVTSADFMARGFASRLAETTQYLSCLLVVWQWALPCALILSWPAWKLCRLQAALLCLGASFSAYLLATTPISYASRRKDYQTPFDAADSIVVACESGKTCASTISFWKLA